MNSKSATRGRILRPRNVAVNDVRPPMLRLLQDCCNSKSGMVEVEYAQQWPTLNKAARVGYVDDFQRITELGRAYIARAAIAKAEGKQ